MAERTSFYCPPSVLGVASLALTAVYGVFGGLLATGGRPLSGQVFGGCLLALALFAFIEAALGFGSHTRERSARLRGPAALTLLCVLGLWLLGVVWLVATGLGSSDAGLATAALYAVVVLPLLGVAAASLGNSQAAVRSGALGDGLAPPPQAPLVPDPGRRSRLLSGVGLLCADVLVVVLVLVLTGPEDAGHVGYRVLWVSAVIAAVVMALTSLANLGASSAGTRVGLFFLWAFSLLQTLVTALLVALAIVPSAGSDTVPLIVLGVIALFGLTFATVLVGRTWRVLRQVHRSSEPTPAAR